MANKDVQTPTTKKFFENKPGFRVTSGVKLVDGELKEFVTDYSVYTDEYQGIAWYKNGLQRLVVNLSLIHISEPTRPY